MSKLNDRELDERYAEMLDEVNETVHIGSLQYNASHVLKNVDPVACRCGFNDWLDAEISDGILFELDGEYYDDAADLEGEAS